MREKQTGRSTAWNQELSESSMQGKLILTFRVKNFVQIFCRYQVGREYRW